MNPDPARVTAVVAAAGSGARLGAGGPKALVEVAGRPLVAWSLDALGRSSIDEVVVAAPPGDEERFEDMGVRVVTGGASRSESVLSALAGVETEFVVVHDAARPLAPPDLFDGVVSELGSHPEADGVIAAAPLVDTLKRADASVVSETVSRDGLWAVQTPQAFRVGALRRALDVPPEVLAEATDDASLIEAAGGTVRIHEATAPNPKLTTRSDLALIAALL